MNRLIVLASASPRREEILRKTGLDFIVRAGNYEEQMQHGLRPAVLARRLSTAKAMDVAGSFSNALIIAADTFIVFREHLLGKPHTPAEAKRMLRILSGKVHSVITGFTVIDTATGRRLSGVSETKVFFRRLQESEIESYIKTGEPLDKAGAYGIQGLGALLIKKIEGDYYNVMGLPLNDLMRCLKSFGVSVL